MSGVLGRRAMRLLFGGLIGACCGYLVFIVAANLEDISFYTVRSLVTGKTVLREIVYHPADKWIVGVLLVLFVSIGAGVGIRIAWSTQSAKKGDKRDKQ